jgi:Ca2+-binding EF-hand superfamily protein
MFDKDNTSTIDLNEFKSLWNFIIQWEKVFRGFDEDRSGSIDKNEFRNALTSFGNKHKKRMSEYKHLFTFRSTIFSKRNSLLLII